MGITVIQEFPRFVSGKTKSISGISPHSKKTPVRKVYVSTPDETVKLHTLSYAEWQKNRGNSYKEALRKAQVIYHDVRTIGHDRARLEALRKELGEEYDALHIDQVWKSTSIPTNYQKDVAPFKVFLNEVDIVQQAATEEAGLGGENKVISLLRRARPELLKLPSEKKKLDQFSQVATDLWSMRNQSLVTFPASSVELENSQTVELYKKIEPQLLEAREEAKNPASILDSNWKMVTRGGLSFINMTDEQRSEYLKLTNAGENTKDILKKLAITTLTSVGVIGGIEAAAVPIFGAGAALKLIPNIPDPRSLIALGGALGAYWTANTLLALQNLRLLRHKLPSVSIFASGVYYSSQLVAKDKKKWQATATVATSLVPDIVKEAPYFFGMLGSASGKFLVDIYGTAVTLAICAGAEVAIRHKQLKNKK